MTGKIQNVFYLFLLLFFGQEIFAQESLPTIKAKSTSVDIRIDEDYFAKGGWSLDPTKKPDIFSIGSKWLYETKKVTFTTDIDSISFNVQPGRKYDFIILLNGKVPCYTQIATLPNPVFMNKKILIPILLGFAIIFVIFYFNRNKIGTRNLLKLGYIVTILFWVMTFISGLIHGNYNHLKNTISELGAAGTASEIFTSSVLILVSLLCTLFSIGFYKVSKQKRLSVIPAFLSFAMPITMIWAGIFTLGNEFHSLTGPLPFLIIAGSLLGYTLWGKNKEFSKLRSLSLISFFIMMLILLRFIKPFGYEYEGLIQRFFYLGWSFWTIAISYYFSNDLKRN